MKPRIDNADWLGSSRLGLLVLTGVLVALLLGGCVAQVKCPLGSYPVNAAVETAAGGNAGVSVPTASGNGYVSTSGQAACSCRPFCGKDTALDTTGGAVRCVPLKTAPVTPRILPDDAPTKLVSARTNALALCPADDNASRRGRRWRRTATL